MTPADVIDVLSKCAAYDQRTIGETDVMAWHEILGRTDRGDALEAVRLHYGETRDRAMPADIRKLAAGVRDTRQGRERQHERRLAIESGPTVRDRSADVTALVRSVADALPQPDAHARALTRARKERGRPLALPPKVREKAKKPKDYPPPKTDDVSALAVHYLRDGHEPAVVAAQFGIAKGWCQKVARRMGDPTPAGWCGQCTYVGRQRSDGQRTFPCPECTPSEEESQR
jgi:hypothetical protein